MSDREQRYQTLTQARKACGGCPGVQNASTIDGGRLDCDHIGAMSQWQSGLHAELMVVLRDFANVEGFVRFKGRPGPGSRVPTNKRLATLIREEVGIPIEPPDQDGRTTSDPRLFFTNAVLCMKEGDGMSADVPRAGVERCGQRFLRPLVELVAPRVIVTLGEQAFRSAWRVFAIPGDVPALRDTVAAEIRLPAIADTLWMPLFHPSPLQRTRSFEFQRADWRKVRDALSRPRRAA
jgi:DNA polymerase